MHDDDWTFTSMDAKIVSPKFHTWGLKYIQYSYNIHTYLSVIASNETYQKLKYYLTCFCGFHAVFNSENSFQAISSLLLKKHFGSVWKE